MQVGFNFCGCCKYITKVHKTPVSDTLLQGSKKLYKVLKGKLFELRNSNNEKKRIYVHHKHKK
ncbi:MAG: hypothetical protein RIS47_1355 [Bacteroidota bacterium]